MIKYGLISETDGRTLEKTIDLIIKESLYFPIHITEIGLYNCETSEGIYKYLQEEKNMLDNDIVYTGIDCEKDKLIHPPDFMNFIRGRSDEVCFKIKDDSQHLIFVDGCHCFAHVVSDFFCYAPKVKKGGYFCFHDTGKQIKPFKDFQHGDKTNPDAYISVRKALDAVGILRSNIGAGKMWEKVFDEYDELNEAGGIICFKKLN